MAAAVVRLEVQEQHFWFTIPVDGITLDSLREKVFSNFWTSNGGASLRPMHGSSQYIELRNQKDAVLATEEQLSAALKAGDLFNARVVVH